MSLLHLRDILSVRKYRKIPRGKLWTLLFSQCCEWEVLYVGLHSFFSLFCLYIPKNMDFFITGGFFLFYFVLGLGFLVFFGFVLFSFLGCSSSCFASNLFYFSWHLINCKKKKYFALFCFNHACFFLALSTERISPFFNELI